MLALVGHGRGARRGVVAGDQQHAAVFGGAGVVGVAEDVAAAIDARALAVPHRKHAVELGLREQVQLLRAPHRRGGEVFVEAGLEADVVLLEEGRGAVQGEIQAAQRRAAIARDIAGGVQAGAAVEFVLQHGQAGQGLHAGEEDRAAFEAVLVFEAYVGDAHPMFLRGAAPGEGVFVTLAIAGIAASARGGGGRSGAVGGGAPPVAQAQRDAVRERHAGVSASGAVAPLSRARRAKRSASFGARPGVLQGQTARQMPQP